MNISIMKYFKKISTLLFRILQVGFLAGFLGLISLRMVSALGLPLYPIGLVYYKDGTNGKQPGDLTTPNAFATAFAYRSNIDGQFSVTDADPVPGRIIQPEFGDPALTSWDVGYSQWSNINSGDYPMLIIEVRNGLNGWTGANWVGGAKTTLTAPMIQNLQIDYRDTVLEPIPTPTFQSSTTSSLTINWQGLWDNSTGASGGSGPASVVGYTVYRSTNGGSYSAVGSTTQTAGGTVTYTDSTVSTGSNYTYKLGVRFEWTAHTPSYYEPVSQGPASASMSPSAPTPVMLKFLSGAPSFAAGTNSPVQTIQSTDALGNATNATSDTTVLLQTSSDGANAKFFSVSAGSCTSTQITDVTITSGTNTAQFCYYDEKAGSWTLTGHVDTWTDATETATVTSSNTLGSLVMSLGANQKNRIAFTGTNTLTARDTYGNTMTGFSAGSDAVTFSISPSDASIGGLNGSGSAQLSLGSDFVSGIANLTSRLTLSGLAGNYTITATTASGKTISQAVTLAAGSVDHFDFSLATPQVIAANFTGTNTLTARDVDNNIITAFDASQVPVTISEASSSGTVSGLGSGNNGVLNQVGSFTNGVANLTGAMKYTGTATTHSFRATAGSANSTSNAVDFTFGVLAKFSLSFNSPQANAAPFTTATITAQDAGDNTVTNFNAASDAVALSVSGTGSLNTTSLSNSNSFASGVATLDGTLVFTGQAGSHTITATSASAKTGTANVTITAGSLNSVKVVNGTTSAATEITTTTLTADQTLSLWSAGYDVSGNWTGLVSGTWTSGGTLAPAVSASSANTVVFAPTTAPASGTITFTSGALSDSTGTITVNPGTHHHFVVNAPGTATAGAPFNVSIVAVDADGNTVSSYGGSQTLSFSGPGSGPNATVPSYPATVNFSNGIATTASVTLVKSEITRLNVSQSGKTGQSGDIAVSAGSPSSFSVNVPSNATAGTPFSVGITAIDQYGNIDTGYSGTKALSYENPSNAPDGTAPQYPSDAEFSNGTATVTVTLYKNETTTLKVIEGSLNGTSANIAVAAGAAASIAEASGNHQTGPVSQQLALPVGVVVKDAYQNLKSQYGVGFTVITGGGSVVSTSVLTGTNGIAETSWTLGAVPGTDNNTLHATGSGLSGSPVPFTASANGNGFVVTAPANARTGAPFAVQIRVVDMNGDTVTSYNGIKTLSFSGPGKGPNGDDPTYPATVTFVNGVAQPSPNVTLVAVETTTLTVSDGAASLMGTSAPISVVVGDASKLTIVTAPQRVDAGKVSAPITVCVQDQYGNEVIGGSDRTLTLGATSAGGQFSTAADGPWDSYQATLATGLNCLTVYYRDTYAGIKTITLSSTGLSPASQSVNIAATTGTNGGGTNTTNTVETVRTITVYVNKPTVGSTTPIAAPTTQVPLPVIVFPTILSPREGALVAAYDGSIIFTGTAPVGQSLRLRKETGETIASTTSDKFGQWRILVSEELVKGSRQNVYIEVYNEAGVRSTSVSFVVKRPTFWDRVIDFVGQ